MKKIGVIFGGKSSEHEISCLSAASVIGAMDRQKFEPIAIGITKEGKWKLYTGDTQHMSDGTWIDMSEDFPIGDLPKVIDFALPILHGPYGEDGTIQGLFEMMDIPYGGCGVLASALAMDKGMAKDIFAKKGLPICKYHVVTAHDIKENKDKTIEQIEEAITYDMFVKPANMGSSVGITKVKTRAQLEEALLLACQFDRRIIIEESVDCRDVETGVMGNQVAQVCEVGEIVARNEFYDYTAKYTDDAGTELVIPAKISEEKTSRLKSLALLAYNALDCQGYARVDFFIERETDRIYINEINTIPGFTKYSMFPTLWRAAGVPFGELIERIIELGYERYNAKNSR